MRKFVGSEGQLAMDLHKLTDLVELPASTPDRAIWRVDGVQYEWLKGRPYVSVHSSGGPQRLPITTSNKTAAKRAVFTDAKGL